MKFNFTSPLIWAAVISLVIGGLSGAIFAFLAWGFLPATPSGVFINRIERPSATSTLPSGANTAQDEGDLTVSVVKKVSPAVVSISVSKDISRIYNQVMGGGSGFVVRADGLIVTNKHVVADAEAEYTVVLQSGKQYPATVLAKDAYLDIAVIKIEAKGLPTVQLGNSDTLAIGQTVVAIGNVLGEYKNSVTRGVVSGIKRRVVAGTAGGGSEVIEEAIQTDAAINPGNSGGPLLNLNGEVVGINTAVNQQGQAVGFALPINSVKNIIQSVEKHGRIVRPWLGVRYILLNKEIAERNNLAQDYGALLIKGQSVIELAVMPGSPADKAGLVENDIILEVNGKKITEENTLSTLVGKFKVGDEITLKVFHKGEIKDIKLKLEELPAGK